MELSAGSHGLPGRGRVSGISAARHWASHPTVGWNCAAAVVFSRGLLVVVPALGARRDRSGERPLPRQEGHRARRARRLPDVRLARDRPRRPHLRRDVHQWRGSDIWPDDKNLALQLTGELLTLRSEQRAAPYGAAPRPETSAHQLCQRNCCGLRAESWEIITLTSAGPPNAIAASSALFRSFGFSTNQPLPPNASRSAARSEPAAGLRAACRDSLRRRCR